MSDPSLHLSDWTLELFAEGELPADEQTAAAEHLEKCARCSAEVEAFRVLFSQLGVVPRFAPGPRFNDAVMARVRIPEPPLLEMLLQRWLPKTKRAWAMFLAVAAIPVAPLVALLAWVATHPMVTAEALASIGAQWAQSAAWTAVVETSQWAIGTRVGQWILAGASSLSGFSGMYLAAVAAVFVLGIPLSTWLLVRLVRTPAGEMVHVN